MKNPIAELEKPDSLKFIKPEEADYENQDKTYYCLDEYCLDPTRQLYLKKSTKNKLYFSHGPGFDHQYSPQTLLRKLAIAHFRNLGVLTIPPKTFLTKKQKLHIDRRKTDVGYSGRSGERPDILLTGKDGRRCFAEVAITGPVPEQRARKAREEGIPFVEINLQDFYEENREKCEEDVEFIQNNIDDLLAESAPRKWRYLPEKERIADPVAIMAALGALGAVAIVGYFLMKR